MPRGIQQDITPIARRDPNESGERPAFRSTSPPPHGRESGSLPAGACRAYQSSITDWIQFTEMGRRDAVIVVHARDGREARVFCKAGQVVDATWDLFTGEDAFFRVLALDSARVSVEFGVVNRRRAIFTPTANLLLRAAWQRGSLSADSQRAPPLNAGSERAASGTSTAPSTVAPKRAGPRRSRGAVWALPVLVPFAVALWWSSHRDAELPQAAIPPAPSVTARAALPAPSEPFSIHVVVEPPQAEIRLDGKQVAIGALTGELPRDGRAHVLRISADGYVPTLVTFRDQPPSAHVTLEPMSPRPRPVADALGAPARPMRAVAARRPLEPPSLTSPPSETAGLAPASKPRIQAIDERQPRVRAIDDSEPHIRGLE